MRPTTRTLIIIALTLALITNAYADFEAYGEPTINIDTCGQTVQQILIHNTEQATQTFSISTEGLAIVKFSEITFEVPPQQYKQIDAFYEASCEKEGEYPLIIYFTTGDTEKALEQNIIITRPDTINLTMETKRQQI